MEICRDARNPEVLDVCKRWSLPVNSSFHVSTAKVDFGCNRRLWDTFYFSVYLRQERKDRVSALDSGGEEPEGGC